MEITRISLSNKTLRTSIPPRIHRALAMRAGDYLVWSYHTNGAITLRRAARPDELAARAATAKPAPRPRRPRHAT